MNDDVVFCGACGTRADGEARFCGACGADVRRATGPSGEDAPTLVHGAPAPGAGRATDGAGALQGHASPQPGHDPAGVAWAAQAQQPPAWGTPPSGYGVPVPMAGHGAPPVGPPGPPIAPYPYPMAPVPPSGPSTGLVLAGVGTAVLLLVLAVGATVALTSGGDDPAPQVVAPVAAATTTTAAAEATTTTVTAEAAASRAPRRTTTTRRTTPVASDPSSATTDARRRTAAQGAVRRHWALIENGSYSAAFDLFGPGLQSNRAKWIADQEVDQLSSVSLSLGRASLQSATSASVPVVAMRTVADSGCFRWTGSYGVVLSGGTWRLNRSSLDRSPC